MSTPGLLRGVAIVGAIVALGGVLPRSLQAQTSDDVFAADRVGRLELFVNSKDWKDLRDTFRENTYYPADLHWEGQVVRNIGIRSRGLGSRSPIKPGLRLDFNRYIAGQEFQGLKSLVLDNLTQDPSMMRERIAFAFFARLGLPAPRIAHAGLFVNGEFMGLYTLVEPLDKKFLARVFGDEDGYLYEFNNVSGWWFDDRWHDDLVSYSKLFQAKTNEGRPLRELFAPIDDMIHAANTARDFGEGVGALLDLDAFLAYLAAEQFIAERDGMLGYDGSNNFYYLRPAGGGPAQFLPWDRDLACSDVDYSIWTGVERNVLAARALANHHRESAFLDVLERAIAVATAPPEAPPENVTPAEAEPAGWLEREARRVADLIREPAHLDWAKPFSNEKFDADVEWLIGFARDRPAFVAAQVRSARSRP